MYLSTYYASPSASSSSISRACRVRFASTTLSSRPAHSLAPPSRTFARCAPPSNASCRSLSFSSAIQLVRCSAPRWCRGVERRSPVSLRAQIRTASPVFERKIATMGMIGCVLTDFNCALISLLLSSCFLFGVRISKCSFCHLQNPEFINLYFG